MTDTPDRLERRRQLAAAFSEITAFAPPPLEPDPVTDAERAEARRLIDAALTEIAESLT